MKIKFRESGHPVFRPTSPLSRGTLKSKGGGNLSIHFCADGDTIATVLRTFICQSAQYLRRSLRCVWGIRYLSNKYGETCNVRLIWPIVRASKLIDHDDLLRFSIEIPAQENLLQKYQERVSCQKDTEDFSQFTDSVACECTLPRDDKSTDPKGWIRGNTKIGPMLEVTTSCLQGKDEVEIRIKSVNKDNSHSFLMDWISWSQTWSTKSTTTTRRKPLQRRRKYLRWRRKYLHMQAGERLKENRGDLPLLVPGIWIDQVHPVTPRINTLLRRGELPREEDGAIEFWRLKDDLRNEFEYSQYWSDDVWKSKMASGGNEKIFQYCADPSWEEILYLQALQGH